jgi:signal recognition particle subunit SRP54
LTHTVFATLSDRLADTFKNLRGKGRLSEADIDATAREIRIALLEADVALPVVKEFVGAVKERARSEEVSGALNPAQQIIKIVHEELVAILGGETRRLRYAKSGPTVIMLAGLQGAGKTTLAAKLALWLKEQDKTPMLVAADLQRPNAVQQLQVNGERAGVPVFAPSPGNGTGDPVEVARASIEEARRKLHDVVIIDTAGRLGVDQTLMQQAADIRDAVQPDEVLFVVDAMIGQDAVITAQAFLDGVGFDGVVLTKLDGDARGGAALSIRSITGKPVMFASSGEKMTDFDTFHPDRMASRILDMGDMLTLIEQAEKAFDSEQSMKAAEKLATKGGFTLEDFLQQMMQIRKLGSMTKIMGMLPGMGQFRDQLENFDEREIDRIQAIIQSMTPAERENPKIIDGSRRARIAKGSGRQVSDVNQLVDRFFEARKMMESMARGGGMPGMPGMPGLPGGGKRAGGKQPAKGKKGKKRVSGNPAKAAQQKAAEQAAAAEKAGNPFGNPDGAEVDYEKAAEQLNLPKDFSQFLK